MQEGRLKGREHSFAIYTDRYGDDEKKKKGKHDICRNVGLPESLRARHTAYGDAPNNVQQISKYKIMVRNHGHGHINHLIIISYHIVSCHHGHRHIIKDSCFVPRGACTRKRKLKI